MAAQHFENAANLSRDIINSPNYSFSHQKQSEVFYYYYLSEKHSCLYSSNYENHEHDDAKNNIILSLKNINKAIDIIEYNLQNCEKDTIEHLNSFLNNWKYIQKAREAEKFAPDARKFWDEEKLIEAFDCYKKMSSLQKEAVELANAQNVKQ